MRAIIIAAGMGKRMGNLTKSLPKCLLKLGKKSFLEWTIEGLEEAGCNDIWIITGYKSAEIVKLGYNTIENLNYKNNNILHSFFTAKGKFDEDLIVTYSDIYVEKNIFRNLVSKEGDLILTVDRSWKDYYKGREQHPIEQAEKAVLDKEFNVKEIGKDLILNQKKKYYEFIGLFKVSKNGCAVFRETFNAINKKLIKKDKFERSKTWEKAYLTDFFQYIINKNLLKINTHIISKGWAEFDTIEDYSRVSKIKKSQNLISL